jgi:hypothetical protein
MFKYSKSGKNIQLLNLRQKGIYFYGLIIIGILLGLIGKADSFSVDYGNSCSGLSAGGYHTCILQSDGNVDCYGRNLSGQANDYNGGNTIGVSAGGNHTCVLLSDGNVGCYGWNGDGRANDYSGGDAIGVSAGGYHTCVLLSDGNVGCYGWNGDGQANDYTGGDAVGVSAVDYHTCVLLSDGNVDCYGGNGDGQANDSTDGDAVCTQSQYPDADGDSFDSSVDCDDNNPFIYPGSEEVCDGLDNNCDGTVDEGFDDDGDSVEDCFDNCPDTANIEQIDSDDDGLGDLCDICPFDTENDSDSDGVCGDTDMCDGTMIPEETVPSVVLGVNRFALLNRDNVFDTVSPGSKEKNKNKSDKTFTLQDTGGCSCEQILAANPDEQKGHIKYGCSTGIMEEWIYSD